MNTDKASLAFHGKTQSLYCFELLGQFCEKVFFSSRKEQEGREELKNLAHIYDHPDFNGAGPLAGILSAFKQFPQSPWLVLACDLPFVDFDTIKYLIENRNLEKTATAYHSAHDGLPEPLCAIFEPQSYPLLIEDFHNNKLCPRKFLIHHEPQMVNLKNKMALDNVNSPDELAQAVKLINPS